ncbi:hypothetical protein BV372_28320 [Nostoc sp. T09]|uniref:GNAT family N-acetyltransferase n=1 Tax=Nostoc sp. T09 TaxID=1932621 RepID=UPI000A381692|nr:GNAT family N-acetyltransferase [Nostoc sp. T09]OUL24999.1 hypothetical protein BV372_28320 [Nostoc sp. T09]
MSFLETRKSIASDFDFIYSLHQQTLYAYVEQIWGHKEEFQRNGMREDFDSLPFEIVCNQGEDIGAISVVDQENVLLINYLAIMPTHQRQGFGTQLLRKISEQAAKREIPARLSVIRINPAKAFYEHFGFKVVASDEHLFFMEWRSS